MTPAGESHDRRLRHVDALRAIAALLVVWRHVGDAYLGLGPGVTGRWLADLGAAVDVGRIGVVAFFLISGYVIPFSIRPERAAPVATFLIRRFFRIFPAYWLSVPLGAFATCWLWGAPFGFGELLVNLTLLQSFFGVREALGLYWTLVVEWGFYLLCVALLVTGSMQRPWRWFALACAGTGAFLVEAASDRLIGMSVIGTGTAYFLLNLSMMLLGTLVRRVLVERDARVGRMLVSGVTALLAWHVVVFPVSVGWVTGSMHNPATSYALGVALFLCGMFVLRIRTRLTDWLGRISYSIYLFHPVVFMTGLWALLRLPAESPLRAQHLGIYILVNAVVACLLAAIVHRWVEQPGIELGRRLARRWVAWRQPKATGVAPA